MTDVTAKYSSTSNHDCGIAINSSITSILLSEDQSRSPVKGGYYDADKCRAHIANQSRVSKIDRFATQICNAKSIEIEIQEKIRAMLNSFQKQTCTLIQEFMELCKLGLLAKCNHHSFNKPAITKKNAKQLGRLKKITLNKFKNNNQLVTLSDELSRGSNLKLMLDLIGNKAIPPLNQDEVLQSKCHESVDTDQQDFGDQDLESKEVLTEEDWNMIHKFDPHNFVTRLKDYLINDRQKSEKIMNNLVTIRESFEKLASEHRINVDLVYAAEEERQSASCIRRSAYNLSKAAIIATSTPVHVKSRLQF